MGELTELAERLRERFRRHEEFRHYRVRVDFTDEDAKRERAAAAVVERHAALLAGLDAAGLTVELLGVLASELDDIAEDCFPEDASLRATCRLSGHAARLVLAAVGERTEPERDDDPTVWLSPRRTRYHRTPTCGDPTQPTRLSAAVAAGLPPCKVCKPPVLAAVGEREPERPEGYCGWCIGPCLGGCYAAARPVTGEDRP